MAKSKSFIAIVGATAALAVGTFGAFTLIGKLTKKEAAADQSATVESIFSADNSSAPADVASATAEAVTVSTDAPAAEAAPAAETPPAEAAAETAITTETPAPETASTDAAADPVSAAATAAVEAVAAGGDSGPLTADAARQIGEEVARRIATEVAQQIVNEQMAGKSGGSASGGLTADEARKIGAEEGRRAAEEVARANPSSGGSGMSAAEAERIGIAAGRRAAQQVAARTARQIVRNEFANRTAPAAVEVASAGASVSAESNSSSSSESAPAASSGGSEKAVASADSLKPWWRTSADSFDLVYAGQPRGESAIALLFSTAPNAAAMGSSVKVYDKKGNVVSGTWEAAANPKLMIFRGVKPGRYTIVVESTLADASGKTIPQPTHGPVFVI